MLPAICRIHATLQAVCLRRSRDKSSPTCGTLSGKKPAEMEEGKEFTFTSQARKPAEVLRRKRARKEVAFFCYAGASGNPSRLGLLELWPEP
jgi:hypothetical protein